MARIVVVSLLRAYRWMLTCIKGFYYIQVSINFSKSLTLIGLRYRALIQFGMFSSLVLAYSLALLCLLVAFASYCCICAIVLKQFFRTSHSSNIY